MPMNSYTHVVTSLLQAISLSLVPISTSCLRPQLSASHLTQWIPSMLHFVWVYNACSSIISHCHGKQFPNCQFQLPRCIILCDAHDDHDNDDYLSPTQHDEFQWCCAWFELMMHDHLPSTRHHGEQYCICCFQQPHHIILHNAHDECNASADNNSISTVA